MPLHALVTFAPPGWLDEVREVLPGGHVAVFANNSDVGIVGRLVGLELRDTLLVLRSGPKSSFIFLFRKPVNEPTVADQIAKSGTGGLNIEPCRIATSSEDARAMARCNTPGSGRMYDSSSPIGTFIRSSSSGALDTSKGCWPSNLLLVHGGGCVADMCEPPCPVKILDEQSFERGIHSAGSSRGYQPSTVEPGYNKNWGKETYGVLRHGDAGGASRFYPHVRDEAELLAWVERLITPALPGA